MLLKLKNFIIQEKLVSLSQIARKFSTDEAALKPILDIWIQKGKIRIINEALACEKKCFGCHQKPNIFYEKI